MAYDYLDQNIVASILIQPHDDDSFYSPDTLGHTGYARDGNWYADGAVDGSVPQATWYTEFLTAPNQFRGSSAPFPKYGLALLSPVSLVILDESTPTADPQQLPLWMQFVLGDKYALTNNYNGSLQGFTPSGLTYADGVLSVIYVPDLGNGAPGSPPLPSDPAQSLMVVNIDFVQDQVYLDVAL